MADTFDLSHFVMPAEDQTARIDLAIEGIDCAACIDDIEGGLRRLAGVERARLNFSNRRLSVTWREGETGPAEIIAVLARMGYRAHPFRARDIEDEASRQTRHLMKCLAVAGFAAMNVMLLSVPVWLGRSDDMTPETRDFFHWLSALIALPAAAYAGQPFFASALRGLRARSMNMDVPISLGVILALGMSLVETINHADHAYFDSALMLLFFLLCGRYLDHAMRRRMRMAAGNIAALKGEMAHRLSDDGTIVTINAEAVRPGDLILVQPGERLPADGEVLSGRSDVDEGLITGETAPRPVLPGTTVYAGSLNYGGALTIRAGAAGGGMLIDEAERLVAAASEAKSKYVRLADRAARLYAPVVHVTAALTAIGWLAAGASVHDAVVTAIAVLIITCPCALALAVPAVQVVASGALFKAGVFLNSGDAIERLAGADTLVFDKTGTLTLPQHRVANAAAIPADLLSMASRLALSSSHPLAMAVAGETLGQAPYSGVEEEPGQGLSAIVDGIEARLGSPAFCAAEALARDAGFDAPDASVICFRHGARNAALIVRQGLRSDAAETTRGLAEAGYELHILSGDRRAAVAGVANALGIGAWRASCKPADKIAYIEALKAGGRKILMIGDGLNDAPALAAADVSISPVTAADFAQAQADLVFLGERLAPVATALAAARRAHALMRQNLWLAVIYNCIAVPLAIAGFVTPLIAAASMSASSVLVTLNALRAYDARARGAAPGKQAPGTVLEPSAETP
ncbi:heavy metal translocating P-type ATPase [Methylocapsa palsarum]|uniref:Cu2+-exporting ATPase n=1 Tax=Methylocapsa palsarum TaxID=1612308 RepID=A0A1I3ZAF5_9HYPH|nr:heavy metal translocating P-type ATPase [Methylocapsa palsarum]SFK40982.1 Cu2+-exporting ATPase [Methylocapsa palsarum]